MALDFPSSPAIGQTYPSPPLVGVPVYTWDGSKWSTQGVYIDNKVTGPASATDGAAARFDQTTGKLIKNSTLLIADSGKLSAGANGVPIAGRTTNAAPGPGEIGEFIKNIVPIASGLALVSGSAGQVWNSINLTPGVWLVGGTSGVFGTTAGSTQFTHMHSSHGNGITSINTSPGNGDTIAMHITSNNSNGWMYALGVAPYFLSAPATINACMTVDFSGGTAVAYGVLWGLRIA